MHRKGRSVVPLDTLTQEKEVNVKCHANNNKQLARMRDLVELNQIETDPGYKNSKDYLGFKKDLKRYVNPHKSLAVLHPKYAERRSSWDYYTLEENQKNIKFEKKEALRDAYRYKHLTDDDIMKL